MGNSLSEQSSYFSPETRQHSHSLAENSAQQALQADAFPARHGIRSGECSRQSSTPLRLLREHSASWEKSARLYKGNRRSDLFDKDSELQAEQARNKRFPAYEKFDHFKDGEKIPRESVCKRLPESQALTKLRERAKEPKEGASKEEKLATRQAKIELEMYEETNYRRALCHGDVGIISYSEIQAKMAQENSVAQDAKNKCGHFENAMKQIAGYGFNNGYSVVMGWMTSPGHRAELLKLSNKEMGASQVKRASTINFAGKDTLLT